MLSFPAYARYSCCSLAEGTTYLSRRIGGCKRRGALAERTEESEIIGGCERAKAHFRRLKGPGAHEWATERRGQTSLSCLEKM
eukprot:6175659-Pleurochrysis_carterae.AAC.1